MQGFRTYLAAAATAFVLSAPALAAEAKHEHHIVFQVSEGDPARMNLTLNNVVNVAQEYGAKGDMFEIEVVTYGPGLTMLRDDKSPVKDRLKSIKASIPGVTFSACGNTIKAVTKKEGKAPPIVPQARIVPAGVVRITELEEQGWTYIKP